MKLSHKLEYACRVMAQLARFWGQGKMSSIDALSEAEAIPANYLVQILNELRGAGLISSKRGKAGGYALARPPNGISLDEIVKAVEPELLAGHFDDSGHSGGSVAEIWNEIGEAFERKLRGYTLDTMTVSESGEMYYI